MMNVSRILVVAPGRKLVLAAGVAALLCGCGQKGDLFIPTGPAAEGRLTLPQVLTPAVPGTAPSLVPAPKAMDETGTAKPVPAR